MSVLSRDRILVSGLLWWACLSSRLVAQERPAGEAKESPPPVRRFFDRPIDYWQHGLLYEEDKKPGPPTAGVSKSVPSEWGQLVKQADGSMAYRELPRPLVDVLEDPSPEKIRAYFEWKLARTQKILRAAEAMKGYKASLADAPGPAGVAPPAAPREVVAPDRAELRKDPSPAPAAPVVKGPFTVTYFHRSGCPHCDTQDVILSRWLKDKPEAKLMVVDFGEKPELWQRFQVRGTPSLVIQANGSDKPVFLEGVSQEAELTQALQTSSTPTMKKTSPDRGDK